MANKDAAFGLRPVGNSSGAPYNGSVNKYYINSTYATALFIGDPVVRNGTSNTTAVDGGRFSIGELPEVEKATAGDGNAITGVIVGFEPDFDNRSRLHNPASTERVVMVADDPNLLCEIQADGIVAVTEIGLNAVLIYANTGSTVTGLSGVELDTSSDAPAADASNQLTIVKYSNDAENNDTTAANVNLMVRINNHSEAQGVIGL